MRKTLAALGLMLSMNIIASAKHSNHPEHHEAQPKAQFTLDTANEVGPFYFKHLTSDKVFRPSGGSEQPADDTPVQLHDGPGAECLFSYIPIADKPGFGLIKHWKSGKFVQPKGGSPAPGDWTQIVIRSGYSSAAVWAVNHSARRSILHVGGRYVHPKGGSSQPYDNTDIVLFEYTHSGTWFFPVDEQGRDVNVNRAALAGGRWEIVFSVETPVATQSRTYPAKQGMSKAASEAFGETISDEVVATFKGSIGASSRYALSFPFVRSETWSEEATGTRTIRVIAGQPVTVWQLIFDGTYAGVAIPFRSNFYQHTDSPSNPPQMALAVDLLE